jgi:dTDP-4-amino-4,6-dideoxygalactose transaminase
LVPDYNCGNEIEAVVKSGYTPIFYPINPACQIDTAAIENLINQDVNAILITHFNGFPQPVNEVAEYCTNEKIFLIEDCAHVLNTHLNNQPLGSFGDISIFSLRKQLPLPDGGILSVRIDKSTDDFLFNMPEKADQFSAIIDIAKTKVKEFSNRLGLGLGYGATNEKVIDTRYGANFTTDFKETSYNKSMSGVSKFLLRRFDLNKIAKIRQRNYKMLYDRLIEVEGINTLFPPPDESICPWLYLAVVSDPWDFYDHLSGVGIPSVVFWSFFHPLFPFGKTMIAEKLKRHVIGFPIHQNLSGNEMAAIAHNVKKYFKN